MSDRLRPDWTRPAPGRMAAGGAERERILAEHDRALAAGDAGYLDPTTGLFVMTAGYLRDRGHCCNSGCRHCPWAQASSGTPGDHGGDEPPDFDPARGLDLDSDHDSEPTNGGNGHD